MTKVLTVSKVTTTDQFNDVKHFMKVAGQAISYTYTGPSTGVAKFRLRLIDEELHGKNELFDSIERDDLVKIIDGICDVLYVVYGAYATFGLEPLEQEISTNDKVPSLLPVHVAFKIQRHITDGFEQTRRGLYTGDMITVMNGLGNLLNSTLELAKEHNIDVALAFEEVHNSNMSKFCKTYEDAKESIDMRIKSGKTEYEDAYIEEVEIAFEKYYVIKRKEDGKVLKGFDFFEPDLEKFVK